MNRAPRQADRGAVVPTVAIFMLALFAFFSLAFNMGLIMSSRAQLQNASDSAALAAARSLNGEASGLAAARRAADAYSREHIAAGEEILINGLGNDLLFGRWHLRAEECLFGGSGTDCFEPLPSDQPRKITAVKVYNGRDGQPTHNDSIELPFGAFVGATTSSVDSAAVAVGAGSAVVECSLPLAVAECKLVDGAGKMKCNAGPQRMVFSNANIDAVGYVNLYYPEDTQAPNETFAADVINERRCNPKDYRIGPAKLQNGNDFAKVIDALRGTGKGATGICLLGKSQSLAVTDAGCPGNPIFQGVKEVVGFVKATVVAVTDNHGDLMGCPGEDVPALVGPFEKNAVIVDISCEAASGGGEWGGGRAYNSSSDVRVRLVD
jgi:hypothetical protein